VSGLGETSGKNSDYGCGAEQYTYSCRKNYQTIRRNSVMNGPNKLSDSTSAKDHATEPEEL